MEPKFVCPHCGYTAKDKRGLSVHIVLKHRPAPQVLSQPPAPPQTHPQTQPLTQPPAQLVPPAQPPAQTPPKEKKPFFRLFRRKKEPQPQQTVPIVPPQVSPPPAPLSVPPITGPVPQAPVRRQSRREEEDYVLGTTFDFEDFLNFELIKAKPSEIESLIILERALSKSERFAFGENVVTKWIMPVVIGVLAMGIVIYILQHLGIFHF